MKNKSDRRERAEARAIKARMDEYMERARVLRLKPIVAVTRNALREIRRG